MPRINIAASSIAALFAPHAPDLWQNEVSPSRAAALLGTNTAVPMIVLAADLRSSTALMKEADDLYHFAVLMGNFVNSVRKEVRTRRGWFDKFTGDGFLTYWILDERPISGYFKEVIATAEGIIESFKMIEPELRRNSRNFPNRVGMAIGLDAGYAHLVRIADDLTIVGHPVVGAVRMVTCAGAQEIICNSQFGYPLIEHTKLLEQDKVTIETLRRPTKEYPDGQVVFSLGFKSLIQITRLEGLDVGHS